MKTNKLKPKYETWQEAAVAAGKLGIKNGPEYLMNYNKDPLLPSSPRTVYHNFPGQKTFHNFFWGGRKGEKQKSHRIPHCTYAAAVTIIRKNGIQTISEYKVFQKKHPELRLPPSPSYTYKTCFPGWTKFLSRSFWAKGVAA